MTPSIRASHIVGGVLTYELVSTNSTTNQNNYRFTLNLYRDPLGIDFPTQVDFGIYIHDNSGSWSSHDAAQRIPLASSELIPPITDQCKTSFLLDNQLEQGTYSVEVSLDIIDHNYMITYQACCRNFALNNVLSFGDIGAVYDVIITPQAQRLGNNSPPYNSIPPQFVCANFDINVDHSATDVDGDSLVYSFCLPKSPGVNDTTLPDCCGCVTPNPFICTPPYDDLVFINDFTPERPMNGNPVVTIHPDNGMISGTPDIQGAYIVAVCVDEYRDGVLIGSIRRDFQYIVIVCDENLVAEVISDRYVADPTTGNIIASYDVCGTDNLEIINASTDTQFIENYSWSIYDGSDLVISEQGPQSRDINVRFDEGGLYTGYMVIDDGASCSDTAFLEFIVTDEINLDYSMSYDTCVAGPIDYVNNSVPIDIEYSWEFGDGNISNTYLPAYSYQDRDSYNVQLSAIDTLGCTDTLVQILDWFPYELTPPDTIIIDSLLCFHDSIFIFDQWIFDPGTYFNFLPALNTGCDSIVERFEIEFTDVIPVTEIEVDICEGESYTFIDRLVNQQGIYLDTLISVQECDSIIQLDLIITDKKESFIIEEICEGDLYDFNGELLDTAGFYLDTLSLANGCDSIIQLELVVNSDQITELDITICNNDFFIFLKDTLTDPGIYDFVLEDSNSCDSTVSVLLQTNPISTFSFIDTICSGEEYLFGNELLQFAGIYVDTLTNIYGCDSIVILDLIVGTNLSRIDLDTPLEEFYGSTLILSSEVIGEELISNLWFETDSLLANSLSLEYVLQDDAWIFFESTNSLFCAALDSIFIKSIIDKSVYIPNAITPNGDNFNDIFYLGANDNLQSSRLSVYDRWGNLMYQNERTEIIQDDTGWDGTFRDNPVEIGTYTYVFELRFINGEEEIRAGSVNVFR